ncbi:MAG: phage major capsid protein [Clostridiales bacterium]|nr:phage major capsid protein [Clostridiales bacterium]
MITTKTADNALKSYYLDAVSEQLNVGVSPLLARIKQTTADVWGRDVRKLVRFGINGGIGAGTEEGALPTAGGNNYAQFVSTLKNLYGTIEISDKAIRASANNEGAFVNLLNAEMDGLVRSASFNFSRMLFGDGSGVLGTVTAATGTFLTLDDVSGIAEGMVVDIYSGDNLVAAGRTVTLVDQAEKSVSISGDAITNITGMKLVVQNSYNMELTGLKAIMSSTGSLYGVARSTNSWMIPQTVASVGELTEQKLQKALDLVEERSGKAANFIVCSWGVRRALANVLSKYKTVEGIELEGGYRAIAFNGIPVVADRFCPKGTMYLLNTDDFALHQLCDWQWLEGEDGKVLRQVPGKPVYTATLVKYAELMCTRPSGQGVLTAITEA